MKFLQKLSLFILLFTACLLESPPALIECRESESKLLNSKQDYQPEWNIEPALADSFNQPSTRLSHQTGSQPTSGRILSQDRPQPYPAASERRQVQVVRNQNGEYVVVPVVPSFHTLYRGNYSPRPNISQSAISGLQAYRASQAVLFAGRQSAPSTSVSSSSSSSLINENNLIHKPVNSASLIHSHGSAVQANQEASISSLTNNQRVRSRESAFNPRDGAVLSAFHDSSETSKELSDRRGRNKPRTGVYRTNLADHLLDERPSVDTSLTSSSANGASASGSFVASNGPYGSVGSFPLTYSDNEAGTSRNLANRQSNYNSAGASSSSSFSDSDGLSSQSFKQLSGSGINAHSGLPRGNTGPNSARSAADSFHHSLFNSDTRKPYRPVEQPSDEELLLSKPKLSKEETPGKIAEDRIRLEDDSPRLRLEEALARSRHEEKIISRNNQTPRATHAKPQDNVHAPNRFEGRRSNSQTAELRNRRPADQLNPSISNNNNNNGGRGSLVRIFNSRPENTANLYGQYESAYLDRERVEYDANIKTSNTPQRTTTLSPQLLTTTERTLHDQDSYVEASVLNAGRYRPPNKLSSTEIQSNTKPGVNEFESSIPRKPNKIQKLPEYEDYSYGLDGERIANEERIVSRDQVGNNRQYDREYPTYVEQHLPSVNVGTTPLSLSGRFDNNAPGLNGETFRGSADFNEASGGSGRRGRGGRGGRRRLRQRMRTSTTSTTTTTTTTTPNPNEYDDNYYDYEEYDYGRGDNNAMKGPSSSTTTTTTTTTTTNRPRFGGRRRGPRPGRGRFRPYGRFGHGRRNEGGDDEYANFQATPTPSVNGPTSTTTSTTTTPSTTTKKLSPNYKHRPDGRIIDYNSDPNFPYELKGADLTNYPFFISIPEKINFNCQGRHDGYYASIEHSCQIYHHCAIGYRYDFLCPNYTLFDQTTFTCRFVNTVDCEKSEKHFNRNDELYVEKNETDSKSGSNIPKR